MFQLLLRRASSDDHQSPLPGESHAGSKQEIETTLGNQATKESYSERVAGSSHHRWRGRYAELRKCKVRGRRSATGVIGTNRLALALAIGADHPSRGAEVTLSADPLGD